MDTEIFTCKSCGAVGPHKCPGPLHYTPPKENTSDNNGGPTDYYRIDPSWKMAQDVIESREMNFSQGNIFKAAFTFNVGRHDASNYERELNKIIYFAQRELDKIKEN